MRIAKTKALISFAVTAKLICVFVFSYAKSRFSHDAAHIIMRKPALCISHQQSRSAWSSAYSDDQQLTCSLPRLCLLFLYPKKAPENITITSPCNILQFFTAVKRVIFR